MAKNRKRYIVAFSARLAYLMHDKNLTQQELADFLGIARQTVQKYVKGKAMPEADILADIAEFFDVSIDYLIFGWDKRIEGIKDGH